MVRHPLVQLATRAIETFVRQAQILSPPTDLSPEMEGRAGTFVSIHLKDGSLRGCIGTVEPTQDNIAEEIVHNAIAAATRDPRFPPITPHELDSLDISVDVLTPAEPVESIADLDPQRYGVIVQRGWRRGLLLPALEGVDTAERQVEIARLKAGIGADEPVQLFRFEVKRYH